MARKADTYRGARRNVFRDGIGIREWKKGSWFRLTKTRQVIHASLAANKKV
jgi:hypothetical protein